MNLSPTQFDFLKSVRDGKPWSRYPTTIRACEERGLVVTLSGRHELTATGAAAIEHYEAAYRRLARQVRA